ncbi:MAG: diguanylate cyclase [Proteobacteria bacterium]|nr:diguanylate cyclase [Pseudomonadota bacterium]
MADKSQPSDEDTERDSGHEARVVKILDQLMEGLDSDSPADETMRRMLENAMARAARAEEVLEAAQRRLEWLGSRNIFDEVTGLLNRRGLRDALQHDLARARRYGDTGALMLVDVVQLATIREEHGVDAANYVLTAIGNILQTRFREVDRIGWLEGGRFAIALTLIGQEDARKRAAILKGYLDEVEVPWQGRDIPIRIRVGLAYYGQRDAVEDLLERAEAELEEREQRIARLSHPAE